MPALTIQDLPSQDELPPDPYPHTRPPRDTVYPTTIPLQPQLVVPSPAPAIFTHYPLPQTLSSYQPHVQPIHHNPYPSPQLLHKVWILDCRSCGTFLTNRGMKAVLLLRPNISLFSTDALPVNCSAYSANSDALCPLPCRFANPFPPRTCECLTQTLCCHTCGAAIGYMIVLPCSRCMSSISATNRATNGHRFVFHSTEIMASERHHIPDEPGVLPIDYPTPPPPSSPPPLAPAYPVIFHSVDGPTFRRPGAFMPSQTQLSQTSSPALGSDHILSPQLEPSGLDPSSALPSPDLLSSVPPTSSRRSPRPPLQSPFPYHPAPHTPPETRRMTPELYPRKLKAGDVLFWHHLTKHGEIPGVKEDPRARMSTRGDPTNIFDR